MNEEIRIPLHFKEGVYPLASLPAGADDDLVLCSESFDILSYRVPKQKIQSDFIRYPNRIL